MSGATNIRWCKTCVMPSSRPRIVFGDDGICNACKYAEEKKGIDWDERYREFRGVVQHHRRHPAYDCIVPFSGGKDSAYIGHRLKHEFGLRPLLVCYGQLAWTDVGRRNLQRVCASGLDIHYWRCDQDVSARLARRFFIERGHPKQHYDSAVNAIPLITAVNFGIPLVFYAEFGEAEYGGLVLDKESYRTRNLAEVLEHQVGDDARNWAVDGITEAQLYPYIYPDLADVERVGVKAFYFSYFFPWNIYENAIYARDKLGFERAQHYQPRWSSCPGDDPYPDPEDDPLLMDVPRWWGKSDGSFEGFDSIDDEIDDLDLAMMHAKFGFGRSARMASRLIQNGHMTREQGLELVRRYDGEFPKRYLPGICKYLGMTEQEIRDTMDLHRNPEIWTQENGEWKLRFPPQ